MTSRSSKCSRQIPPSTGRHKLEGSDSSGGSCAQITKEADNAGRVDQSFNSTVESISNSVAAFGTQTPNWQYTETVVL